LEVEPQHNGLDGSHELDAGISLCAQGIAKSAESIAKTRDKFGPLALL
jgi:hypothetical protein